MKKVITTINSIRIQHLPNTPPFVDQTFCLIDDLDKYLRFTGSSDKTTAIRRMNIVYDTRRERLWYDGFLIPI